METEKRRRGRPRKEKGRIEPWQFKRAGLAMCAYDEARGRGEKHSGALEEAVSFVKELHPEMSISEGEVRRILASWRPRNAGTILRFEQSVPTEPEIEKWHRIRESLAALHESKGPTSPVPPKASPPRNAKIVKIRFGERPNHPRSNSKIPKE